MSDPDARMVQRRALAGLLWSKQVYRYDVKRWLDGDAAQAPPPASRLKGRNADWTHLDAADVILMPDTWEYPWFASWDLAFHAMAAAIVDPALAKQQLLLLTRDWYMHPNGQLPAYEWNFGDANPPIQAFAALRVYRLDAAFDGAPDRDFLERLFHKLMVNFTYWVNRKDSQGRNLFQGGFLGLDNIGVFDRSAPIPGGGTLEQADATAWMAMYALNLMRMALELAEADPVYEDIASKFFEHFLIIASAMTHVGASEPTRRARQPGLWDDDDGFFYDALILPDGTEATLRVRSLVGLIPSARGGARRGAGGAASRFRPPPRLDAPTPPGPHHAGLALCRTRKGRALSPVAAAAPAHGAAAAPAAWTRANSCRPSASGPCRRCTRRSPSQWSATGAVRGAIRAGRLGVRHLRRQFELARPRLDAAQRHDRGGDPRVRALLR